MQQLDVEGLQILVTSGSVTSSTATKSTSRSRAQGLEILSDAKLLLKQGKRYALVGRNGTGKSSEFCFSPDFSLLKCTWVIDLCPALLRAIAEKLIPGIPEGTRIALLQQSRLVDADDDASNDTEAAGKQQGEQSVLQEVVNRAIARDTIEQEIKCKFMQESSARSP